MSSTHSHNGAQPKEIGSSGATGHWSHWSPTSRSSSARSPQCPQPRHFPKIPARKPTNPLAMSAVRIDSAWLQVMQLNSWTSIYMKQTQIESFGIGFCDTVLLDLLVFSGSRIFLRARLFQANYADGIWLAIDTQGDTEKWSTNYLNRIYIWSTVW